MYVINLCMQFSSKNIGFNLNLRTTGSCHCCTVLPLNYSRKFDCMIINATFVKKNFFNKLLR